MSREATDTVSNGSLPPYMQHLPLHERSLHSILAIGGGVQWVGTATISRTPTPMIPAPEAVQSRRHYRVCDAAPFRPSGARGARTPPLGGRERQIAQALTPRKREEIRHPRELAPRFLAHRQRPSLAALFQPPPAPSGQSQPRRQQPPGRRRTTARVCCHRGRSRG